METKVSDTKIDWDAVMDATNSHLGELQANLLLSYEAQNPNIVHLYPQAIANPAGKSRYSRTEIDASNPVALRINVAYSF